MPAYLGFRELLSAASTVFADANKAASICIRGYCCSVVVVFYRTNGFFLATSRLGTARCSGCLASLLENYTRGQHQLLIKYRKSRQVLMQNYLPKNLDCNIILSEQCLLLNRPIVSPKKFFNIWHLNMEALVVHWR